MSTHLLILKQWTTYNFQLELIFKKVVQLFSLKKEYVRPDFTAGKIKYDYFKNKDKYTDEEKKNVFEKKLKHNDHFIKDVNFSGKFNRMICFDSKRWHAAEVCDKERLVIISFIDNLQKNNIK